MNLDQQLTLIRWILNQSTPFTAMNACRVDGVNCDWHAAGRLLEELLTPRPLLPTLKYAEPAMDSEGHMRYELKSVKAFDLLG
jgi:hypothetical protein